MKLIKPSYRILTKLNPGEIYKKIEIAGRTCYKSEDKITEGSASEFIKMVLARGHESVIEHYSFSVKFICDRGVSHEIVRHRLCSFSQESTRYCNYSKSKFNGNVTFIIPEWLNIKPGTWTAEKVGKTSKESMTGEESWLGAMLQSEAEYNCLIAKGWQAQQARSVLPNSLKTEIVVTANIREWREIFRQRTAITAHPQMRELMRPLLDKLKEKLPVLFNDIHYDNAKDNLTFTRSEVIKIVEEFAFFLSDNGKPDTDVGHWMSYMYPVKS